MPAIDPHDLLRTSEKLITQYGRGRPLGTHIRRSVSTIYYALFHSIAASNANMLAGNPGTNRHSSEAWTQVYRAMNHGIVRKRCESKKEILKFPMEIRFIASYFCFFQGLRELADYNPDFTHPAFSFTVSNVKFWIRVMNAVTRNFARLEHNNPSALTEFAVYLLFNKRRD